MQRLDFAGHSLPMFPGLPELAWLGSLEVGRGGGGGQNGARAFLLVSLCHKKGVPTPKRDAFAALILEAWFCIDHLNARFLF